jgi:hypothetical protein
MDQMLYFATVTFPTLGANASATNTLAVPGVLAGDLISWNLQSPPAHLQIDNIYVSASGVLTISWGTDATGITGATVAVLLSVCRYENISLGITTLPNAIV